MVKKSCHDRHVLKGISALALLVLAGTAGCAAQSEMTNLWKDPSFTSGPVHNVFVVAIRKDPVRRRRWEDAFVKELTARGVTATPSYTVFPEASPDTQQVIDAVRKNSYDAVLSSVRLPDETTTTYVPGTIRQVPVTVQDYYGRLHSRWVMVQDPGYTETDKIIQVQTDLWSTAGDSGRLIWSGTLRTLDSVNLDKAVSKEILPQLEKQGVVPKKAK
jgi:hypothetical protein